MLDLMAVRQEDGGVPLYVQTVMRILREMRIEQQNTGNPFRYQLFKERVRNANLSPQQLAPLQQRLETLESFMEQKQEVRMKRQKGRLVEGESVAWSSEVSKI